MIISKNTFQNKNVVNIWFIVVIIIIKKTCQYWRYVQKSEKRTFSKCPNISSALEFHIVLTRLVVALFLRCPVCPRKRKRATCPLAQIPKSSRNFKRIISIRA